MVEHAERFSEIVANAQDIAIVVDKHADLDAVSAAASLFIGLQDLGKTVRLFVPNQVKKDERLIGLEQSAPSFGHQNLLISFAYSEEQVDKISYHIGEETKRFYLTVKPKKGAQPLDTSTMELSYTGAEPDVIITVGVSNLEDLDELYIGYEDTYSNTTLIAMHEYEVNFGVLQLTSMGSSSMAEVIVDLLRQLGASFSPAVGTNLLLGIEDKTRGLRYGTLTADTFSAVSDLLRAGGERTWIPIKEEPVKNVKTEVKKMGKPKKNQEEEKTKQIVTPEEMTVSVSRK